jgi:nickel-dependent lactate racemase
MTLYAQATAPQDQLLSREQIHAALEAGLGGRFNHARLLILIPDHTRTIPLPQLFRLLVEVLHDARKLDFMVALGTHPPLSQEALYRLVGVTADEYAAQYSRVGLLNHAWDDPDTLVQIGTITRDEVREIAGEVWHPSLGGDVPVRINRLVHDYDHILIIGPTFPHEVAGFSGGAKYLFPGISGPEMINVTHWLGALITILNQIGIKDTPVRAMIHAAARFVATPITLVGLTVVGDGLAGMFIGDLVEAWHAAADCSATHHITWVEQPFQRVLSFTPPMYDELWTGAKAMYKLEPAIADGGEVIVYAPHLDTVSHVHGKFIYEIGYHVRDYFLKQWDAFRHVPMGVIAHSTHLKGWGWYDDGVERPRIHVTLASRLSPDDCARLNLGYLDPASVRIEDWLGREAEGVLYVPKAGEMLYRLKR